MASPKLASGAIIENLPLSVLHIDSRYQRALGMSKVKEIAKSFSLQSAGLLTVSLREDGTYAVIDGQHRLEAMKLCKITHTDCEVYLDLTIQDEAFIFAKKNSVRKQPDALDVFRARMLFGEMKALHLHGIVEEFSLHVAERKMGNRNKHPHLIYAVESLEEILAAGGDDHLRDVLSIVTVAWPNETIALENKVLRGVSLLARRYAGKYDRQTLIEKMRVTDPTAISRRANAMSETLGGHGSTNFARALVEIYNKNKRSHRLDPHEL